jgi:hypothetical protein
MVCFSRPRVERGIETKRRPEFGSIGPSALVDRAKRKDAKER